MFSRESKCGGAFLSILALLMKEALLLGLRRWIDVFQEESMVNCRLCADSVLGVHVHQLRQQAEKGVSRFDGGDAFAHHVVDDASLAERGARFNIRHYVRPFHRTVFVKEKGAKSVEPSLQAEQEWVKHHDEVADETLVSKVDSWYTSANVPGKMRRVIPYCGGANVYREHCDKVRKGGFAECLIS